MQYKLGVVDDLKKKKRHGKSIRELRTKGGRNSNQATQLSLFHHLLPPRIAHEEAAYISNTFLIRYAEEYV